MAVVSVGGTRVESQAVARQPRTNAMPKDDRLLMSVDNHWRLCHALAVDWKRADRKRKKLEALLDDPELLKEIPSNDDERLDAEARCRSLGSDRYRLRTEFQEAALTFDRSMRRLDEQTRAELIHQWPAMYCDSPLFELALIVPVIPSLPTWIALLARFKALTEEEKDPCPF